MTTAFTGPPEGEIILPRKAPLTPTIAAALGMLAAAAGGVFWSGQFMTRIDGRFDALALSDTRIIERSDGRYAEVKSRLDSLERDRADTSGRLIRLEEQVKIGNDLLREIREGLRTRR